MYLKKISKLFKKLIFYEFNWFYWSCIMKEFILIWIQHFKRINY